MDPYSGKNTGLFKKKNNAEMHAKKIDILYNYTPKP